MAKSKKNGLVVAGGSLVVENELSGDSAGGNIVEKDKNAGALQGNESDRRAGQWVKDSLVMHDLFPQVAKEWADKQLSWDQLFELLNESKQKNFDDLFEIRQLSLVVDENSGDLRLLVNDDGEGGGEYSLSGPVGAYIGGQQCTQLGNRMLSLGSDPIEKRMISGLYQKRFEDWKKGQERRRMFLRLRRDADGDCADGSASCRAMLTDRYGVVDNLFLAETVREFIPGGLISHFDRERYLASGGDFCRYNVLIPESVRKHKLTDFGGMENVSNSEVGTGRYSVLPSLFSAICRNGCIWGSVKDKRFALGGVHRGRINLDELRVAIGVNLQTAIPMFNEGLELMLGMVDLMIEGIDPRAVVIQTGKILNLTKNQIQNLIVDYGIEAGNAGQNAYSVINSITRTAQRNQYKLQEQQCLEESAGELLRLWAEKPDRFNLVLRNAEKIDVDKWYSAKERALEFAV